MAKNLADLTGARNAKNGNGHAKAKAQGLRFGRFFTPPGSHAYDLVEWDRRTAAITGEKGQVIFEQKDVEVLGPGRSWPSTSSPRSTSAAALAAPSARPASARSSIGSLTPLRSGAA